MPTYLVTGARAGIGLGYIQQLAASHSNVVFAVVRDLSADLSSLNKAKAAGPGTVHVLECDVSSEASITALPRHIQAAAGSDVRLNVVINNAAVLHSRHETSLTLTGDALHSHIQSNVVGPALVTQALIPLLAPGAVVVNISSGAGSLAMLSDGRVGASYAPYSISKAALNMLTVHQAKQLGDRAIVVCVDPGHVKTVMGADGAEVEVDDSARGVLRVVQGLKKEDSGKFYHFEGRELEW